MSHDAWPNLVSMFFRQADRFGERPLLWHKRNGNWAPLTWREVAVQICMLSRGLRSLGVHPGDRVVLVAENRPAWFVADLAVMAIGAVTVGCWRTQATATAGRVVPCASATSCRAARALSPPRSR